MISAGVGVIRRPGVVHGDPAERGKHAHRFHRLPAAPGVDHEQGTRAGAGAVHPVQAAAHPEPGLVEPGHLGGGDLVAGARQEPAQPPGRAGGQARDRPGRQRDAEQLGQRLRGALLGQELAHVQVDDDRGDPRPVLHRRLGAWRGRALGAVPAAAFPLDQLMLGHRDRHFGQVEDPAALHPGDRPPAQPGAAPAAAARLMAHFPVRPGHLRQRAALVPVLPARLAARSVPQRPRPRRRLARPLTGRRPGGVPRRLPQPRLELSDPLPGLRQILQRPHQRGLRLGQLPAQRDHQRGQHLIPGTSVITRHTGTVLPPTITRHYSRTLSERSAPWCGTRTTASGPVGDLRPS